MKQETRTLRIQERKTVRTYSTFLLRRMLSSITCFIMVLSVMLLAVGCDRPLAYFGDRKDLATTTINSIPGFHSTSSDNYLVLDEDEYGRVLFAASCPSSLLFTYSENERLAAPDLTAILVMQKADEQYAYFYGEENYLLILTKERPQLSEEVIENLFSKEAVNKLMQDNDWGKPPEHNRRKSVKAQIMVEREHESIPYRIILDLEKSIGKISVHRLIREDANGNRAYFTVNTSEHDLLKGMYQDEWYLILLDAEGNTPNGECSVMRIEQDADLLPQSVSSFLEQNNWQEITE